jgi:tetratricopeptide (TPR) repeat protein
MTTDSIPKTLGKYEIIGEIGRGGFAAVYEAVDTTLDRTVALKVLAPHLLWDPSFLERFQQEAKLAARLKHPNIVVIYEFGTLEGVVYIAMEYLGGQNLAGFIREEGALAPSRILKITSQVASALDYAHSQGLVHRDIKPSNIMVGTDDHVTVTDFGIAKAAAATALTTTGKIFGTPEYMSPEQAMGTRELDARSDNYSLGVVVYQMFTGQVPFSGETPLGVMRCHVDEPPPPPLQINPAIPPAVEAILLKALAKDREKRYQRAGDMALVLEEALREKVEDKERAEARAREERARQEQIAALYEQALGLARARQWRQALAKVAEIQVLDPQFADPEGIAARAREEAAREEETQRQNELAALYAEAVRLLRAGQYREALEKWEEVQARDPRYPDRQNVQANARKKLAALAETAPPKRGLPRWNLAIVGGLALVAIVAVVVLLINPIPLPIPPPVVATATATPSRAPSPIPTYTPTPPVVATATATPSHTPSLAAPIRTPTRTSTPTRRLTSTPTPHPGEAYFNQGLTLLGQGKFEQAIAQFDQALVLGWETAELYHQRAWACHEWQYYEGGCSYEQAIADYTRAIKLDPRNPDHYGDRAWSYVHLPDIGLAITDYTKAIELEPQEPRYYYWRGWTYTQMKEVDLAIADYNRAIELDPDYVYAYINRGQTYQDQGDYQAAIRDYDKAIEINPQEAWAAYLNRGIIYDQQLGNSSQALSDLNKAVELAPNDPNPYFHRGVYFLRLEQWEALISDMTQAIPLAPTWPDLYGHRGYAYRQLGQVAEAWADYEKFLELTEGNPGYADWRTDVQKWLAEHPK